jgi:Carboxypeptidase regulatory-like domain
LVRTIIPRVLALCILSAAGIVVQTGSSGISGTVLDAAGATVPDASIEIESVDTGSRRATMSGASGVYSVTGLAVGRYTVRVQAPGFQSYLLNNVQLQVGKNLTLDAHLELASAATSINVAADALPLDEVSATVGGIVSGEQVRQLPVNGRSWATLETQTPGAIDSGTGGQRSIRFAGYGLDDNNYRFDGVDATGVINQAQKGNFRLQFSMEAIAEFRADAAVYTAENGGTQGGQVNVVSRSGTNEFHGSLFEYLRKEAFDARGPFDSSLPPFRLNQFGGSFGGPLRKNRGFLLRRVEQLRQRVGQTLIGFVPSAAFRAQAAQVSPALSSILAAYPAGTIATGDPNVMRSAQGGR